MLPLAVQSLLERDMPTISALSLIFNLGLLVGGAGAVAIDRFPHVVAGCGLAVAGAERASGAWSAGFERAGRDPGSAAPWS